jgi:putative DNA primase/helicase
MPEPPTWLLAIWQDWDKFKPQMLSMCPWAEPTAPPRPTSVARIQPSEGGSVIDKYIAATSLESALRAYGYTPVGKRWLSPHSGTKLPGVVIFDDDRSCWVHHASDPLCSDDSGRPVNAFDLYCFYEHNGDIKRAVKALSTEFGNTKQHVHINSPVITEDGEILNDQVKDTLSLLPYTNEKGKPIKNIDNLREICNRLNVTIRYNVIKKE